MHKSIPRRLRKHLTDAEQKLWYHLRLRRLGGYKFRRQQVIGRHIVDFICLERRLIVEVDGGQHAEQVANDSARTAWLAAQGFRVIRSWNTEVLFHVAEVCETIFQMLEQTDPTDPPS